MTSSAPRVLLVASHPVQYAVPLYRLMASDPRIDLTVAFLSLRGARPEIDPDFGVEVRWDVPLLDGYRWVAPSASGVPSVLRVPVALWRLVWSGRFDAVLSTGYRSPAFVAAIVAARWSRTPLLLMSEQRDFHVRDGWRFKKYLKRVMLPSLYRRADGCCALSSHTVRFFRRIGVSRDRIFLTPYVVDNDAFQEAAARFDAEDARRSLGLPPGPIALFCGKLVLWKRPWDVLDGLARIPGLTLVVAGDGPLRRSLEERAARLGIADRVRWLGFVNQSGLPRVYAACDFLVLPSASEGFGLVVNEIFNFGKPVVVSDAVGAVGDLVEDGVTGFVVKVGDVRGLTRAMERLANDSELRSEMGSRARERVRSWGPVQHVEAFIEAVHTIVGRRRAAPSRRGPL